MQNWHGRPTLCSEARLDLVDAGSFGQGRASACSLGADVMGSPPPNGLVAGGVRGTTPIRNAVPWSRSMPSDRGPGARLRRVRVDLSSHPIGMRGWRHRGLALTIQIRGGAICVVCHVCSRRTGSHVVGMHASPRASPLGRLIPITVDLWGAILCLARGFHRSRHRIRRSLPRRRSADGTTRGLYDDPTGQVPQPCVKTGQSPVLLDGGQSVRRIASDVSGFVDAVTHWPVDAE